MKHSLILYILKFQNHDLVKIGITQTLVERICVHQDSFQTTFDLTQSYVIVDQNRRLKLLERQMLSDLIEDIPTKFPFDPNAPGNSEIRKSDRVETFIELLKQKHDALNLDSKIYKGIDISGFRSDIIPEEYYPINEQAWQVLPSLLQIVKQVSTEKQKTPWLVLNEFLYEHMVSRGLIASKNKKCVKTRLESFVCPNTYYKSLSSI